MGTRWKHGHAPGRHFRDKTPTYRSWLGLRSRAKHKPPGYEHVDQDPRWEDFTVFLADMKTECPPGWSIHRKDSNRGYWPDNCVWADDTIQKQETRKRVSPIGQAYARGMFDKMPLAEIAEVLGCSFATVRRIVRGESGFVPADHVPPLNSQHNSLPPMGVAYARGMKGQMSQRDIAAVLGCSHSTISRINS